MHLRDLLTALKLQPDGPGPGADPFLCRLQDELRHMGPDRLEYLAAFAGQLARVAYADDVISAEEATQITAQLREYGRLSTGDAQLIVDLLRNELEVLRSVQNHILNRAINATASQAEKETLLDCLYAVAAADHGVSEVEEREIRLIA